MNYFRLWLMESEQAEFFRARLRKARLNSRNNDVLYAIQSESIISAARSLWEEKCRNSDQSFKPSYYHLVAEKPRTFGSIASAAVLSCIATGRTLDGCGGPGYAISSQIVDALDRGKSGSGPKMIVDTETMGRLADMFPEMKNAFQEFGLLN